MSPRPNQKKDNSIQKLKGQKAEAKQQNDKPVGQIKEDEGQQKRSKAAKRRYRRKMAGETLIY